jgi:hypothetical protein
MLDQPQRHPKSAGEDAPGAGLAEVDQLGRERDCAFTNDNAVKVS